MIRLEGNPSEVEDATFNVNIGENTLFSNI